MALGIVSDEEFLKELENSKKSSDKEVIARIVNKQPLGRPEGAKEVPTEIRKLIAEEALLGADSKELAQLFKVGEQMPSAYKHGATSQSSYNKPNKDLTDFLNLTKQRITKKASNRLLRALDGITTDKLNDLGARDLSGVAKDMSAIVKNMEPSAGHGNVDNSVRAQIVFHAPQVKDITTFDVLPVRDNP
jgi:hypothetical protein